MHHALQDQTSIRLDDQHIDQHAAGASYLEQPMVDLAVGLDAVLIHLIDCLARVRVA
jgi:hypothetical protein